MSEKVVTVNKGSRIRARWFQATMVSLAGCQAKTGAREISLEGIVRHVRVDNLEAPGLTILYVDVIGGNEGYSTVDLGCPCGHPHVAVKPMHVFWAES